jgi:hypothetical protein
MISRLGTEKTITFFYSDLSAGLLCNFSFSGSIVIHTSETKSGNFISLPSCRKDEFISLT